MTEHHSTQWGPLSIPQQVRAVWHVRQMVLVLWQTSRMYPMMSGAQETCRINQALEYLWRSRDHRYGSMFRFFLFEGLNCNKILFGSIRDVTVVAPWACVFFISHIKWAAAQDLLQQQPESSWPPQTAAFLFWCNFHFYYPLKTSPIEAFHDWFQRDGNKRTWFASFWLISDTCGHFCVDASLNNGFNRAVSSQVICSHVQLNGLNRDGSL